MKIRCKVGPFSRARVSAKGHVWAYLIEVLECTPFGGQLRHGLLDSLPDEVLLDLDWTAVAKG